VNSLSASLPAATAPGEREADRPHAGHIVGRGMLALVVSQLITTPISIVVNAMLARQLGASDFGAIYFAITALGVWYLFVEWGGHALVAAAVARDRRTAAQFFASGMVLRIVFAGIVLVAVPPVSGWLGYGEVVRLALWLVAIKLALQSIGALCLAVVRGYEKVHWQAGATVFANVVEASLVITALLRGGGLQEALTAQVFAAAIALAVQIGLVLRLDLGVWRPAWSTMSAILAGGFSFLILDIVVRLQPFIDATFLSWLAPPEALGWYGAASRISGVLVFPALTLNLALYPTLSRLWVTDRLMYDHIVRLGLRVVAILGLLAATGTALFAPVVVELVYGNQAYAPASAILRVMSVFILLVYGSIVLGPSIAAAGRQWRWCAAQSLCLVVSVVLDPVLIPWAQTTYGNGGLGVAISIAIAEVAMVSSGLLILPRGILDRAVARTFARSVTAAVAMAVVGVVLMDEPALAIPAATATYVAVLWVGREIDSDLLMLLPPWLSSRLQLLERRTAGA
jgi:O-antigen/teichoic acid export membrane protein